MQYDLIEHEANYSLATFPEPRPFQDTAHEKLRQGAREGNRCQMIMSPTGSGKTYLGMRIIHEALKRGKRAMFVCDRTTLINQTSEVADSYGLGAHSVIQAGHWRYDMRQKFQIASIQTLARRSWPESDLIVIDEAHAQYKAWVDYIPNCKAHVIALSATPFSKGLGRLFTNLINAATMHDLTQSGVLVPMRVYSCTKIDMRGAETSGGEWKDSAAAERGMEIIGDVVTEWQKYAENRKTIVFGATINHCEELCRQFNESGIMAATFTSDTTIAEREVLLNEYKKPDSLLKVLISVEALAKGFDCIAEGSKVLTHRGLVAIENVLYNDMLWDGCEFVPHGGVIYKGERDVITYSGLTATQDHLVKTAQGWIPFGECARLGIPIACTAYGECCVREDEGYFSGGDGEANNERSVSKRELPVHKVRSPDDASREVASFWGRVQEMLHEKGGAVVGGGKSDGDDGKVYKSISQGIQKLWRAWNKVQFQIATRLCGLDHGKYSSANQGQEYPIGSDRQQWALRAGESSLGKQEPELRKYSTRWLGSKDSQVSRGSSGNTVLGQNFAESYFNGDESRANSQQVSQAFGQTKRRVWDILNAGPRNSFTCEGLLVHNCADVGCVCDCRPLRKSLSTAIQMWGRGLRSSPDTGKEDCIAQGSRVLTDRGLVEIENVLLEDKVWDGYEFVSHEGVINRGKKTVITYAGLTATSNHLVKTAEGWRSFGDCAAQQIAIITTGIGGERIWACEDYFTGSDSSRAASWNASSCFMRLHDLWLSFIYSAVKPYKWCIERLQILQQAKKNTFMASGQMCRDGASMQEQKGSEMESLWGSRNRVSIQRSDGLRDLDCGESWNSRERKRYGVGQNRQRWSLRARQSEMGNQTTEYVKQEGESVGSNDAQIYDRSPGGKVRRIYLEIIIFFRNVFRRNPGKIQEAVTQTEREVWDIINCGPRNSFTCEGLLVHNCVLLDFSGNIVRFIDDYTDIYFNGLDQLDAGEKLDKTIRRDDEEEKEPSKCPACGFSPCGKRCISCGHEKQPKNLIEHLPGEMTEVMIGKSKLADDRKHLYEQICTYTRSHGNPETAKQRAWYLFQDLTGGIKPANQWKFDDQPNTPITRATLNHITRKRIAFAKRKAA